MKFSPNGGAAEISSLLYKYELSQGLPGNLLGNSYTDSLSKVIKANYGFSFQFPPQFRLAYNNTDVVWLQQETQKFYRHIFVNIFSDSIPLNDAEAAIKNRNEFSRKYIKNTEGTSALVSRSDLFPVRWLPNQKIGKNTVHILKGWYQEDGTFRRGPFVRYIFHDKPNHRFIAFDGFVYAPEQARLPFFRLFEILAQTMAIQ